MSHEVNQPRASKIATCHLLRGYAARFAHVYQSRGGLAEVTLMRSQHVRAVILMTRSLIRVNSRLFQSCEMFVHDVAEAGASVRPFRADGLS